MLDPNDLTRITAVLDWEMVTIGDPLMDLGTTLGYWMSRDAGDEMLNMPFNPRVLMENISRQELVEMYARSSGRDVLEHALLLCLRHVQDRRHCPADLCEICEGIYYGPAVCRF